jgi:hypothetical protein
LRLGYVAASPRRIRGLEKYTAINTEIWQVLDPKDIDDADTEWIATVCKYQCENKQMIRSDSAVHQLIAVLQVAHAIKCYRHPKYPKL